MLVAQQVVEALGHTEVELPAVSPTCTETGLTAGIKCSVCGEILVAQQPIDRLTHIIGDWYTSKWPTCYESGIRQQDCSVCHQMLAQEEIAPLNHSQAFWTVEIKPTCTEDGLEVLECPTCKKYIDTRVISATGHNYGEPEWAWTGLETATAIFVCTGVYSSHTEVIQTTIEAVVVTPATCTQDGEIKYVSTVEFNGQTYSFSKVSETIPALGHDLTYHDGQAPTYESDGWCAYATCSRCDYSTYEVSPMLDKAIEDFRTLVKSVDTNNIGAERDKILQAIKMYQSFDDAQKEKAQDLIDYLVWEIDLYNTYLATVQTEHSKSVSVVEMVVAVNALLAVAFVIIKRFS